MNFCWTTIKVTNMEKSLKFYQEIVGLPLVRRVGAWPETDIAFLGEGQTMIELICSRGVNSVSFGKDISLGFETESLEDLMAFLKEKGVAIHSGPFQPNPHIKFIYVTDPDGLTIQFVQNM